LSWIHLSCINENNYCIYLRLIAAHQFIQSSPPKYLLASITVLPIASRCHRQLVLRHHPAKGEASLQQRNLVINE
jgi:hypothetical protein